ncbi:MAG: formate dehydrogenase subunit gamma [Egibacteraceae bacterium]
MSAEITRYSLFERAVHWFVALTFAALLASGLALAYPRMAWLAGMFGGGQSMRWLHPVIGAGFSAGVLAMAMLWTKDCLFSKADREWLRRLGRYVTEGHTGLDTGKYNAGQKGYFWWALVTSLALLATGVPLWFPLRLGLGLLQVMRIAHHLFFLLALAGFIIHVYLSTAAFPGTLPAMTSGRVTRGWAAWHHPRWFRDHNPVGTLPGKRDRSEASGP